MNILFYIAAIVAIVSSILAISRYNAVHALLYLIVSFLSIALIFYLAGAPFIAALEIIIYAGAIMVLFIFVIMMLNLGSDSEKQEKAWMTSKIWIGPILLAAILFIEFILVFLDTSWTIQGMNMIPIKSVGISLFTEYLLGVEIAGFILMTAIIGAYHLGSREKKSYHRYLNKTENN